MKKNAKAKNRVRIFEVGPRDGLQNEKTVLPTQDKVWLCEALVNAGLQDVEAGAFVRQDKVPQMANSDEVQTILAKKIPNQDFWYLVPNEKGLERALQTGVTQFAAFTAVSETFNEKNIGQSVQDSLLNIQNILNQIGMYKKGLSKAKQKKIKVRAYVSTVWGCPFEGRMDLKKSAKLIHVLLKMKSKGVQIDEVSIGDTIGVANPADVKKLLQVLKLSSLQKKKIAMHFHDTRGTALANALMAFEMGIRIFDSSVGGLGGCPFAPGASGNLATEDLVYMFKEMGIQTGVNYSKLCETSLKLSEKMNQVGKSQAFASRALQAYAVNAGKTPWEQNK